jgi:hypothetical protein
MAGSGPAKVAKEVTYSNQKFFASFFQKSSASFA